MPLTLRELVATAELDLSMLTQGPGIDLPVTWVHVSELPDPTPFLSGGELLLTTGIAYQRGRAAAFEVEDYVQRLSRAAVVGLGFGTGLSHAIVPVELLAAARKIGLPIVEVPRQTPFIAISRAVSNAVAADEYAAVTRTFTAQQALTRAALSPAGPQRLVRLLAQQLAAWVVLLDPSGTPIAASSDAARSRALDAGTRIPGAGSVSTPARGAVPDAKLDSLVHEVALLAAHRGTVSSAFPLGSDTVGLQSVGTGPRGRAFLAVGRPGPLTADDRHLVNAAVMLLTIRLEQSTTADSGLARLRSALLRMMLSGQMELARPIANGSSISLPGEPIAVVVAIGDIAELGEGSDNAGIPDSANALVAVLDDELVAIVDGSARAAQDWAVQIIGAERVWERPASDSASMDRTGPGLGRAIGISLPTDYASIAHAHRQARQAADFGQRNNRAVTSFDEISIAGISGIVAPDAAQAFADALLGPLLEHDMVGRGDLVNSLRVWLAHHGQWDPSATELGVHRHTLRQRMRTAEQLLRRSLDAPGTRSELWLALELMNEK